MTESSDCWRRTMSGKLKRLAVASATAVAIIGAGLAVPTTADARGGWHGGGAAALDGVASVLDWERDCWSAQPQPIRITATGRLTDITAHTPMITATQVMATPALGMVGAPSLVDGFQMAMVTVCGGACGLAAEKKIK